MRALRRCFLVPALVILACSDDSVDGPPVPSQDRPDEILLDREADEAALWLSGDLTSPYALYETIQSDLAAIRSEYLTSIPDVAIEFVPWWRSSLITVFVTDELRLEILNHEPNPVDSLNTAHRAASMDAFRFDPPHGWNTKVHFIGRQHPQRLSEIYAAAPGVVFSGPGPTGGDWSNTYPWYIEGGISYLFRHGYGDCPAGCEVSDVHYFRRVSGVTEHVGSFRLGIDPYPAWWSEASAAMCAFWIEMWGHAECPWTPQAAASNR